MQSNIFNYNFYKHNPKLESFVYKRYEFKMQKLDYTIETEDISDISFAVRMCFINYGLEISFDKNTSYSQNIHYTLEFFTDTELKKEFGKMRRDYMDKFYSIRELYELMDNKDKSVHLITEYVMKLAKNYKYKYNDEIHNFSKHIDEFIRNNNDGEFESICHEFHSTSQIKNWLNKKFLIDEMEIINDNCSDNQNDKEYVEDINNIITVDKIINECDEGAKNIINNKESLTNWDVDENKSEPIINLPFGLNNNMFANYLCTMVNPPETFRPPIMPSSSTTSINSDILSSSFKPISNERESDI